MSTEAGVSEYNDRIISLHTRLTRDRKALIDMSGAHHLDASEAARLRGKAEGVGLATSKLEEIIREHLASKEG